jgi:hypothetical protein
MRWEWGVVDYFGDGFTGEGGFFDFFEYYPNTRVMAKRNDDDVPWA